MERRKNIQSTGEFKQEFAQKIADARNIIQKKKDIAWEELFVTSKYSRFIIEITNNSRQPVRDVAPTCFEGRPNLLKFMQLAKEWLFDAKPFSREEYRKSIEAVRHEDSSGYSDYLGHANMLAHQGHWRSAAILCVRAKERLDEHVRQVTGSNGREANYLEAFYRRYSASRKADLEGLDDLLDRALSIYDDEVRLAREGPDPQWPHDPVAERFQSEKMALAFTRSMYDWADSSKEANKLVALAAMGQQVPALLDHCHYLTAKIAAAGKDEPSGEPPARVTDLSYRTEIRRNLLNRARRNIVCIGILNAEFRAEAKVAWKELPSPIQENGSQSRFSSLLWYAGQAIFSDVKKERESAIRHIVNVSQSEALLDYQVFPYDEKRFRAFVEIALLRY